MCFCVCLSHSNIKTAKHKITQTKQHDSRIDSRKWPILTHPPAFVPRRGWSRSNFAVNYGVRILESRGYCAALFAWSYTFSRFDTIPEVWQTDRETHDDGIYRASIALCSKNRSRERNHAPFRDSLLMMGWDYDQPVYQSWNLGVHPLQSCARSSAIADVCDALVSRNSATTQHPIWKQESRAYRWRLCPRPLATIKWRC